MGKDAQHVRKLGDFRATAAEFARHAGFDEAGRLQRLVVFGNEAVALVRGRRPGGELFAEPAGNRRDIRAHFGNRDFRH